jgi:hypothetical protein
MTESLLDDFTLNRVDVTFSGQKWRACAIGKRKRALRTSITRRKPSSLKGIIPTERFFSPSMSKVSIEKSWLEEGHGFAMEETTSSKPPHVTTIFCICFGPEDFDRSKKLEVQQSMTVDRFVSLFHESFSDAPMERIGFYSCNDVCLEKGISTF